MKSLSRGGASGMAMLLPQYKAVIHCTVAIPEANAKALHCQTRLKFHPITWTLAAYDRMLTCMPTTRS